MSSGERPIGAANGKQPNTEALCHPHPPQGFARVGGGVTGAIPQRLQSGYRGCKSGWGAVGGGWDCGWGWCWGVEILFGQSEGWGLCGEGVHPPPFKRFPAPAPPSSPRRCEAQSHRPALYRGWGCARPAQVLRNAFGGGGGGRADAVPAFGGTHSNAESSAAAAPARAPRHVSAPARGLRLRLRRWGSGDGGGGPRRGGRGRSPRRPAVRKRRQRRGGRRSGAALPSRDEMRLFRWVSRRAA